MADSAQLRTLAPGVHHAVAQAVAGADGLRLDLQVLGASELIGGSLLLLHTLIVELAASGGSQPLEIARGSVEAVAQGQLAQEEGE
jgi:hypothetical protein